MEPIAASPQMERAGRIAQEPDAFFAPRPSQLGLAHEGPVHRLMIYLKAQGKHNREIAHLVGYTESWVSQVLRQDWAQRLLLEEVKKLSGRDEVKTFLEAETMNSLFRLANERDNMEARPEARIAASRELLDRALGKPTQHVDSVSTNVHLSGDLGRIEEELRELEQEEKKLLARQ